MDVGGGHHHGEREAAALADHMQLGPWLAPIDRICADMVPPAVMIVSLVIVARA